jgi:hypothetical protein
VFLRRCNWEEKFWEPIDVKNQNEGFNTQKPSRRIATSLMHANYYS